MAEITKKKMKQDVLIEVFHTVQEAFGYLWEDLLYLLSNSGWRQTNLSLSDGSLYFLRRYGHPSKLPLRWAYIPVEVRVLNRDGEPVAEVIRE